MLILLWLERELLLVLWLLAEDPELLEVDKSETVERLVAEDKEDPEETELKEDKELEEDSELKEDKDEEDKLDPLDEDDSKLFNAQRIFMVCVVIHFFPDTSETFSVGVNKRQFKSVFAPFKIGHISLLKTINLSQINPAASVWVALVWSL